MRSRPGVGGGVWRLAVALGAVEVLLVGLSPEQPSRVAHGANRFVTSSRLVGVPAVIHAPRSAQQIRITVESATEAGPSPGYFTYTYTVTNEHNSAVGVRTFGINRIPEPDSAFCPGQWAGFYGWQEEDSAVVWSVTDSLTKAPPGWDSTNIYPSPYEIQPGQSALFRMVSRRPPTPTPSVSFYAQGFDLIPEAGPYTTSEEPGEANFPSLFRGGVTGLVFGPDIRTPVAVEEEPVVGISRLARPAPNPARTAVSSIAYSLATPATVRLAAFDTGGRLVRVIAKGMRPSGYHTATWDLSDERGRRVAAGVYLIRLDVDGRKVESRKVTVVR